MEEKKYDWVLADACSECNYVGAQIVKNKTIDEMKEYLISFVKNDIDRDKDSFDSGVTSVENVEERTNFKTGEIESLYAWTNFMEYHCDFEAYIMDRMIVEE